MPKNHKKFYHLQFLQCTLVMGLCMCCIFLTHKREKKTRDIVAFIFYL